MDKMGKSPREQNEQVVQKPHCNCIQPTTVTFLKSTKIMCKWLCLSGKHLLRIQFTVYARCTVMHCSVIHSTCCTKQFGFVTARTWLISERREQKEICLLSVIINLNGLRAIIFMVKIMFCLYMADDELIQLRCSHMAFDIQSICLWIYGFCFCFGFGFRLSRWYSFTLDERNNEWSFSTSFAHVRQLIRLITFKISTNTHADLCMYIMKSPNRARS